MRKLILALALFVGCSDKSTPSPTAEPEKTSPPKPAPAVIARPAANAAGAAEPAASTSATKPNPSPPGVIKFSVPTAWKQQEPSNNMRKAQYGIPDKQKEAKDGSMALFFFGPSRTRMDAIIERWRGQVTGSEGDPETFEGKNKVTLLDLKGDYAGDFGGEPI